MSRRSPDAGAIRRREDEVVIYTVSVKGNPNPVIVPSTTANTQTGFEVKDPLALPLEPFGPILRASSSSPCIAKPRTISGLSCNGKES